MTSPPMPTALAQSIKAKKITSPDMKGPDWLLSIQIRITCSHEPDIRTPRQALASLANPKGRTPPHSLIASGGRGAVLKGLQKRIGFSPWKHFARSTRLSAQSGVRTKEDTQMSGKNTAAFGIYSDRARVEQGIGSLLAARLGMRIFRYCSPTTRGLKTSHTRSTP